MKLLRGVRNSSIIGSHQQEVTPKNLYEHPDLESPLQRASVGKNVSVRGIVLRPPVS